MATTSRKRRVKKNIPNGIAHIHSTFNNTIVSITDTQGNLVSWSSAGAVGYKGSKKSTPFAAGLASEAAAKTTSDSVIDPAPLCIISKLISELDILSKA